MIGFVGVLVESIRQAVYEIAAGARSIAILSHIHPDGDGFASSLALKRILSLKGFDADIVVDSGDFGRYDYLSGSSNCIEYDSDIHYKTVIILDCNSPSRLGERYRIVSHASKVVLIDHHEHEDGIIANDFQYISTADACVGTILFKAFREDIEGFDCESKKYIANCLYTSIINDTNNFTNINTNQEVLSIASELCRWGLKPAQIYRSYFEDKEPGNLKLIGEVLSTMQLHHSGRILSIYSTLEMLSRNAQPIEALDSLTKWVQGLKGVEAIIYLKEISFHVYKVSLRSTKIDVNKIAVSHGGGGHKTASGLTLKGDLPHVISQIVDEIALAVDQTT